MHDDEDEVDSPRPTREIRTQHGIPSLDKLLKRPAGGISPMRLEIIILMTRARTTGLRAHEKEKLDSLVKEYIMYLDNAATHTVVMDKRMLNPGTFRELDGYVTGSTRGSLPAHLEGEGEITFMGRAIGAYVSKDMNCNVISQGALCNTYSFDVHQTKNAITVVDLLSSHHRNVATFKTPRFTNMSPVPDELLR